MQKKVLWLFGLSGAGKTSIALELKKFFDDKRMPAVILDGDVIRNKVNKDLGFSTQDRKENIRRSAEISNIITEQDVWVVAAFITPKKDMRELIQMILKDKVQLFFIDTDIEECIKRDVKGLYAKAIKHEIENFTGIQDSFEPPNDELNIIKIKTAGKSARDCAIEILNILRLIDTVS